MPHPLDTMIQGDVLLLLHPPPSVTSHLSSHLSKQYVFPLYSITIHQRTRIRRTQTTLIAQNKSLCFLLFL